MNNKSVFKKITGSREFLLAIIVVLMFAIVSIRNPAFFTFDSVTGMLKNNAVAMVMALGMLCVMLVGGIDISITSTLALAGMSIGMLWKYIPDLHHCNADRSCLRSGRWTDHRLCVGSSDHCNDGIHVYLPCHGISCITRR